MKKKKKKLSFLEAEMEEESERKEREKTEGKERKSVVVCCALHCSSSYTRVNHAQAPHKFL